MSTLKNLLKAPPKVALKTAVTHQLYRLEAAKAMLADLQADVAVGSPAEKMLRKNQATAEEAIAGTQAFLDSLEAAENACKAYRAKPSAANFSLLRSHHQRLLEERTPPLAKHYFAIHKPVALRPGCSSCGRTLLRNLTKALAQTVPDDFPALPWKGKADAHDAPEPAASHAGE